MHFSINHSELYNMARVKYTIELHVCLVQLYFKYEYARKCRRKFQHKFPGEQVPSRQNIHYLVNTLKTMRSLLDKKPDKKRTVLAEETLTTLVLGLKLHQGGLLNDKHRRQVF
jgi:hypothetical protein